MEKPTGGLGFSHRQIMVTMSGLVIAMLLAMLDNMIVAPALPTIVGDLGGLEHLAWVTTGYILATTIATPIWGKLGDLYGRRITFIASIVLFLFGSALCGMAQNMAELVGFRALQGLGAGGLIVGVLSIVGEMIPPRDRSKYQGVMMAVMPVAMIGGPLIGGFITDHLSWRWAFYVNLPLGAIALVVCWITLAALPRGKGHARIDWLGTGLLTVWITSLVLITTWGGSQYAWGSPQIVGLAALTVAGFVSFIMVERRAAEPIMPLRVFKNRNFNLAGGARVHLRLRAVRRDRLPAAVPAVRAGRVGDQQRPAADAHDDRGDGGQPRRRPDDQPDRALPASTRSPAPSWSPSACCSSPRSASAPRRRSPRSTW